MVSHSFISTQYICYQYAVRWHRIGEKEPSMGLVVTVEVKGLQYDVLQTQKSHPMGGFLTDLMSGSSLLSHGGDPTLPSALQRFTAEFGMGSVGPPRYCRQTNSFRPVRVDTQTRTAS